MDKKDFEQNIGHKVRIVHNCIDKYFNTSWKKSGIEPTRMQCATMRYLREHEQEDVFQKDLEAAFSISGATATNILKIMEKGFTEEEFTIFRGYLDKLTQNIVDLMDENMK